MATKREIRKQIRACTQQVLDRAGPKIILDVGAYIGNMALWFGQKPEHKVYAFEPCPENFEFLETAIAGFPNIRPVQMVVTRDNGTVRLHVARHRRSRGTSQANSLFGEFVDARAWGRKTHRVIGCDGITVDTFCHQNGIERIDLLKLNCEGGEYEILGNGAPKDFLQFTAAISLALHGKEPCFLTDEFVLARVRIQKLLRDRGFCLKAGHTSMPQRNHMEQFWEKELV